MLQCESLNQFWFIKYNQKYYNVIECRGEHGVGHGGWYSAWAFLFVSLGEYLLCHMDCKNNKILIRRLSSERSDTREC